LAIAECYGIEALIRLLKRTRRDEVRKPKKHMINVIERFGYL